VRSEQLVYREPSPRLLIVGSSLTARLAFLGQERRGSAYTLGLSGTSALDGLQIIASLRERGRMSGLRTVAIETNLLGGRRDSEMMYALLDRPMYDLRRWLPDLRYEYQPLNVVFAALSASRSDGRPPAPGWRLDDPRAVRGARDKVAEFQWTQRPPLAVQPEFPALVHKLLSRLLKNPVL
jgi:hypothetical protein